MLGRAPRLDVPWNLFLVQWRAELPAQQGLELPPVALVPDHENQHMRRAERPSRCKLVMAGESLAQAMRLPGIVDVVCSAFLMRHQVDAR